VIRPARLDDWPDVRALWSEIDDLHAVLAPDYFRAPIRHEEDWRRLLAIPAGAVFVAERARSERGAEVLGVLVLRLYDTPADPAMVPRRRAHVETLVVGRQHRRRGIGRDLMTEATGWARRHGAVELVLTVWDGNREAEAFYERLGYHPISRVLHAKI
jgi:ribosomal protein S18 acetylase RimI-like enzyme